MISTWYKKFRIVTDNYAGYEVQCWRIWFPVWIQCGFCNTHLTIEKAEKYALNRTTHKIVKIL